MKIRQALSNILTAVVIAIALVLIAIGIIPRWMGYTGFYVSSNSMEPSIKVGSLVLVKEVAFEDIKERDVLTFVEDDGEKWFSHRVIKINSSEKTFKTKGDNNNIADPGFTHYSSVIGRVERQVPLVGYISMALDTTWGKITLLVICVFYAAIEVENISASKKRKRKEGLSE